MKRHTFRSSSTPSPAEKRWRHFFSLFVLLWFFILVCVDLQKASVFSYDAAQVIFLSAFLLRFAFIAVIFIKKEKASLWRRLDLVFSALFMLVFFLLEPFFRWNFFQ